MALNAFWSKWMNLLGTSTNSQTFEVNLFESYPHIEKSLFEIMRKKVVKISPILQSAHFIQQRSFTKKCVRIQHCSLNVLIRIVPYTIVASTVSVYSSFLCFVALCVRCRILTHRSCFVACIRPVAAHRMNPYDGEHRSGCFDVKIMFEFRCEMSCVRQVRKTNEEIS